MTTSLFKGYNTIDRTSKFTETGFDLVKRDFLNAINIRQGEIAGRPEYGSTLTSFVFEPMTSETVSAIENEIARIARQDPRLIINNITVFAGDHLVLVELDLATVETISPERVAILFDESTRRATFR